MPQTDHIVDLVLLNEQTSGTLNVSESFASLPSALALILALGAIDWMWAEHAGLMFVGWIRVALVLIFLGTLAFLYSYSGRSQRLSDVCLYAALWVAFSCAGSIFTYLAQTLRLPLRDAELFRLDAAFGFSWFAYHAFVSSNWLFHRVLLLAYASLLPQIVGSILFLSVTARSERNAELLWTAMLSLIVTTIVSGIVPALGPFAPDSRPYWVPIVLSLRDGSARILSLDRIEGIITMPSYHTVLGILITYVHRPPSRSFALVAILNFLMLLSVPEGHHYLVDMIAAAAIAWGCIVVVRSMLRTPRKTAAADP